MSVVAAIRRRPMLTMSAALVCFSALLTWTYVGARQSTASFADTEEIAGNRLGAGTVEIDAGDETALFQVENMAPGDRVTGRLDIVNQGSLPVRFVASASSSGGPLVDLLDVSAWRSTSTCAPQPPTGVDVWSPLAEPTAPPIDGPETARRGRMALGQSTRMCFAAELDMDAPNSAQNQRLEFAITIVAEHDVATSESEEQP